MNNNRKLSNKDQYIHLMDMRGLYDADEEFRFWTFICSHVHILWLGCLKDNQFIISGSKFLVEIILS